MICFLWLRLVETKPTGRSYRGNRFPLSTRPSGLLFLSKEGALLFKIIDSTQNFWTVLSQSSSSWTCSSYSFPQQLGLHESIFYFSSSFGVSLPFLPFALVLTACSASPGFEPVFWGCCSLGCFGLWQSSCPDFHISFADAPFFTRNPMWQNPNLLRTSNCSAAHPPCFG